MQSELRTDRLHLRPLRAGDAGPIAFWAARPEIARMTSLPHPYPPGAAEQFIDATLSGKRGERVWVIDGSPSGAPEFLGLVGLRATGDEAVLGYWLGPEIWGRGYATEAAAAVVGAWLAGGERRALTSHVYEDNPASRRVLEKLGFVETGRDAAFNIARGETVARVLLRLERAG